MAALEGKIIILSAGVSDGSTVVTGPEIEGFPITNLFTDHPGEIWRPGVINPTIDLDVGSAITANTAFIGYTDINSHASSRWRVRTYSDSGFSSLIYDTGDMNLYTLDPTTDDLPRKNLIFHDPAGFGTAAQYWRINFLNLGGGATTWYCGRAMFGNAYVSTRNIDFEWSLQWVHDITSERAFNGSLYSTSRGKYRRLDASISYLSADEAFADFYLLDLERGLDKPVVVCIDPETDLNRSRRLLYGPFEELTPITNQILDYYRKRIRIHEMEAL